MSRSQTPNHLRSYRKRFRLSQEELAMLVGCEDATKISNYERFKRLPGLETALRMQALFGVAVAELFPGLAQEAQFDVRRRLKQLAARLSNASKSAEKIKTIFTLPGCLYEKNGKQ